MLRFFLLFLFVPSLVMGQVNRRIATSAEATAGTDDTSIMTPLKVQEKITDSLADEPSISVSDTNRGLHLQVSKALSTSIGFKVFEPGTNSMSLYDVSVVGSTNRAAQVEIMVDKVIYSQQNLSNLFTDSTWGTAAFASKQWTNNGLGLAPGASFVSTANGSVYFTNIGTATVPKWRLRSATGAIAVTNRFLLSAAAGYVTEEGAPGTIGSVTGETNWTWLAPFRNRLYTFYSDGVNIYSNSVTRRYSVLTNDFAVHTPITNDGAGPMTIDASVMLFSVAGGVPKMGLWVDNDGNGTWDTRRHVSVSNGVTQSEMYIGATLLPGQIAIFTNLTTAVGAETATIVTVSGRKQSE